MTNATETKTTTKKPTAGEKAELKKVSADFVRLSDKPEGFSFEGRYVGMNTRASIDKETGEEKTMHNLVIEDDNGNRTKFFADAGLRIALGDAMIEKGDWFKAVKCKKTKLEGAKTMNQWDIFQYAKDVKLDS